MRAKAKDAMSELARAIDALRADEPSADIIAASRSQGHARLFGDKSGGVSEGPIDGCAGVEALLTAYRRGTLNASRILLIRSHLAECPNCRNVYTRRGALHLATTPWKLASNLLETPTRKSYRGVALLAAAITLCVGLWLMRRELTTQHAGQLATVQAVSGTLYRIHGSETDRLSPGAPLVDGEIIRAGQAPQSLVRFADGSTVELGERAEFAVESRRHDTTLRLNRGQIIVKAAKRGTGDLYIATRDCRVAVTGAVSSVTSDLKGSRVSVLAGQVQVAENAGDKSVLSRGDQLATSPALGRVPIDQEVAWSQNLDEHLALLRELTDLGKKWRDLPDKALRYQSQLLDWAPEDAFLYATFPNYSDTLIEGYRVFSAKLDESPVLRTWWRSSELGSSGAELEAWFERLSELSSYLGDELVVTVSRRGGADQLVVLAEVKRAGIDGWIESDLTLPNGERVPITVVDAQALASGTVDVSSAPGPVLLVTPGFVALSSAADVLTDLALRLSVNDRAAFTATALGQRVQRAYAHGVSFLVAADLEAVRQLRTTGDSPSEFEQSLRLVEFERTAVSNHVVNKGVLTLSETANGPVGWLGGPAPMGTLDFITFEASAVAAFIVRRPAMVFAELLRYLLNTKDAAAQLPALDGTWNDRITGELDEALGSELAVALDGSILPVPAWKLVVEVRDPERMARALEAWVGHVDQELRSRGAGSLSLTHDRLGMRHCHRLRWTDGALPLEAHYAFIDGYFVATPTRALLARAMDARATGRSLAGSSRFATALPMDGRTVFSGLIFQDLVPALASAIGTVESVTDPGQKHSIEHWARESKPTLIALYATPNRIEVAGTGDLLAFGPEALAFPALIRQILPESFNAAPGASPSPDADLPVAPGASPSPDADLP